MSSFRYVVEARRNTKNVEPDLIALSRQISELKKSLDYFRKVGGYREHIDQIEMEIAIKTALCASLKTDVSLLDCGAGGNCFYRCIAKFVFNNQKKYVDVRNDMTIWLHSNGYHFANRGVLRGLDISKPGSWIEGEVEIMIAAETYGFNVNVLTDMGNVCEIISSTNATTTCYLYNESQMHYKLIL